MTTPFVPSWRRAGRSWSTTGIGSRTRCGWNRPRGTRPAISFDNDGALAKKTRRAFCERYADSGTLVLGTHFATPSSGTIVKKDGSFRFVVA